MNKSRPREKKEREKNHGVEEYSGLSYKEFYVINTYMCMLFGRSAKTVIHCINMTSIIIYDLVHYGHNSTMQKYSISCCCYYRVFFLLFR